MTDPKTPDRRRTVQNEQPEHNRRSVVQPSPEKLVVEIPDALERIVSDPEKIGENARKLSEKVEEPTGKNHCGDPELCEKDVYAEDACECCCATRCGPWNDFLWCDAFFGEAEKAATADQEKLLQQAFDAGRNQGLEEAAMECFYSLCPALAKRIREMKKEVKQ